jgi:hypothetical protein
MAELCSLTIYAQDDRKVSLEVRAQKLQVSENFKPSYIINLHLYSHLRMVYTAYSSANIIANIALLSHVMWHAFCSNQSVKHRLFGGGAW